MRAAWLVVVVLAACSPEMVTVCESRGSDPTGPTVCQACLCEQDSSQINREECTAPTCECKQRSGPTMVLAFHESSCDQCGRVCVEPEIPCGAGCTAPGVACPDRPSPYACRMREVPVE